MLILALVFILVIIALAFFLNSALDRREVKRAGGDEKGRGEPL